MLNDNNPIENSQVNHFNRDGYCIIKKFLPLSFINDFEKEIDEVCSILLDRFNKRSHFEEPLMDLLKQGGNLRKQVYNLLQRFPICKRAEGMLRAALTSNRFLKSLNVKVPIISSGMRIDLPDEKKFLTPEHQDIYDYNCFKCYRVWLPLRDVSRETGTFRIYVGSHSQGIIRPKFLDNDFYPFIEKKYYEKCQSVDIELSAGDAVIFNPLTIHSSVPAENSTRIKFIVGLTLEDLTTLFNANDESSPVNIAYETKLERKNRRQRIICE